MTFGPDPEQVKPTDPGTLDRLREYIAPFAGSAVRVVYYGPRIAELAGKTILVTPFGAYSRPRKPSPNDGQRWRESYAVRSSTDELERGNYTYGGEELAQALLYARNHTDKY